MSRLPFDIVVCEDEGARPLLERLYALGAEEPFKDRLIVRVHHMPHADSIVKDWDPCIDHWKEREDPRDPNPVSMGDDYLHLNCDVLTLDMRMPFKTANAPYQQGLEKNEGGVFIARKLLDHHCRKTPLCRHVIVNSQFYEDLREKEKGVLLKLRDARLAVEFDKAVFREYSDSIVNWVRRYMQLKAAVVLLPADTVAHVLQAAYGDHNVLIVGETGTGKEYVAQFLHRWWCMERYPDESPRRHRSRLLPINCAAFGNDATMGRAELFGSVMGAYTDAKWHSLGVCLRAAGLRAPPGPWVPDEQLKRRLEKTQGEVESWLQGAEDALQQMTLAENSRDDPEKVSEHFRKALQGTRSGLAGLLLKGVKAVEDMVELFSRTIGVSSSQAFLQWLQVGNGERIRARGLDVRIRRLRHGGLNTLFLDEIGDLPIPVQAAVLRYLNSWEVQPLGFSGYIRGARARVIAATNNRRALELAGKPSRKDGLTSANPFRDDLFFRLAEQVIYLPPLETGEVRDLLAMLRIKLEREEGLSPHWAPEAETAVVSLVEKGNVVGNRRQLRNIVNLASRVACRSPATGFVRTGSVTPEVVDSSWTPVSLVCGHLKTEDEEPTSKDRPTPTRPSVAGDEARKPSTGQPTAAEVVALVETCVFDLEGRSGRAKQKVEEEFGRRWRDRWPAVPLPFRDIQEYLSRPAVAHLVSPTDAPHTYAWLQHLEKASKAASATAQRNRLPQILAKCVATAVADRVTYAQARGKLKDGRNSLLADLFGDVPYPTLEDELRLKGYSISHSDLAARLVKDLLDLMWGQDQAKVGLDAPLGDSP